MHFKLEEAKQNKVVEKGTHYTQMTYSNSIEKSMKLTLDAIKGVNDEKIKVF
jgi:hypothetical protein